MSSDVAHDTVGRGFLGNLVERTQGPTTALQMPMLERRRPGIFEPRASGSAQPLERIETVIRPDTSTFAPAMAPSTAPQSTRATPKATSSATVPAPVNSAAPAPIGPARRMPATAHVAHIAAPAPVAATTATPPGEPIAASRRTRGKTVDESSPRRGTPMPASPPAAIAPMQAVQAARSPQVTRIEQSRLESRTTLIEREIEKHRDAPASPLKTPPRLTNREAPRAPVAHPVRSAALLATPAVVAPAPVQVSIGRVEIRGLAGAPAAAAPRRAAAKPQLGLDEYLQQRHGKGR
ncbi:MAG: hypothetical protein IPP82_09570 [Xanthomonadales bacterium]|nr:hypothetical protein [Xanthomonadales bacterium]